MIFFLLAAATAFAGDFKLTRDPAEPASGSQYRLLFDTPKKPCSAWKEAKPALASGNSLVTSSNRAFEGGCRFVWVVHSSGAAGALPAVELVAADGAKSRWEQGAAAAASGSVCPVFRMNEFNCDAGGGHTSVLVINSESGITKESGVYYFNGLKPWFKGPVPISAAKLPASELWDFSFKSCKNVHTTDNLPVEEGERFAQLELRFECKDAQTFVAHVYVGNTDYPQEFKITNGGISVKGRAVAWGNELVPAPDKTKMFCNFVRSIDDKEADFTCPRK